VQQPSAMTPAGLVTLLRDVAARDKAAFSALYAATSAKLYGIVLRILSRRDLADEVLQEAYVKIWENAGNFDATRASPITWMATIARNCALDEVRKVRPVSLEDMPAGFDVASEQPLALDVITESEDGRRLYDCLQRLEPEKRDVVVKAYLHGMSRDALGKLFAKPVPTIKTWLHRSLAQLKDCMGS
jgi:RNA polymerase sigma-70 factor, ECF subfamily